MYDPKSSKADVKFQNFMTTMINEARGRNCPSEAEIIETLCLRRYDFVTLVLFRPFYGEGDEVAQAGKAGEEAKVRSALGVLNHVRSMPGVWDYLERHPYFYTGVDRAIYEDCVSRALAARFKGTRLAP